MLIKNFAVVWLRAVTSELVYYVQCGPLRAPLRSGIMQGWEFARFLSESLFLQKIMNHSCTLFKRAKGSFRSFCN